jgi:hypothetical protein
MIGNTEYSLVAPEPGKKCCHNMDLLSATKEPPFVALPYDFDFSGLVQAAYAGPNPKYPIKNVRTRYYKGRCSNNEHLPETLELFLDKRDALFAIVDSVAAMDDTGARATGSVRSYLERFFDIIDDPEEVKKRLVERCLESSPPDNGAPFTIK